MGCGSSTEARQEASQGMCANGPIVPGTRVQTQWDEGAGHDNKWYCGTISAVYTNGEAKITYDDGDVWVGEAVYIYALPPHHPAMIQKFAIGADTMDGVPGAGGLQMGGVVNMMPQQPMMMQPQHQPQMSVMSVMCPPNAAPGSMIMVQTPNGPMEVCVPQGTIPGTEFQFQVPAAAQPQAVIAQPVVAQPVIAQAQPVGQPPVVMGMAMS